MGIKQDQIQPLLFLSYSTVNNFSSYKMGITTSALQGCFVNQIETMLKSLVRGLEPLNCSCFSCYLCCCLPSAKGLEQGSASAG